MAPRLGIAAAAREDARSAEDEAAELVRVVTLAEAKTVQLTGAARWAHLPGNGRGPVQPGPVGRIRVAVIGIMKPLVMVGFLAGSLYMGATNLPNLLNLGELVPSQPVPAAPLDQPPRPS